MMPISECSAIILDSSQLSMTLTNDNYLDSKAKFTCSGGYTLDGPEEIECVWNSNLGIAEWDGSQPSCQLVGKVFNIML